MSPITIRTQSPSPALWPKENPLVLLPLCGLNTLNALNCLCPLVKSLGDGTKDKHKDKHEDKGKEKKKEKEKEKEREKEKEKEKEKGSEKGELRNSGNRGNGKTTNYQKDWT